ncbi:cobalt-precorrin-6A reductase [Streptomyces sp. NBC_01498]|uniref:cobalt-precorrin-6A reductase n=1 Tax=Streptomyces sp. NBC_01498 TaxID=2975870 RepID=UPI002E7BBFCF|nr:cobalt-precorrin-6A reductase [Streptomyces sp. NBC_01498]WTL28653.1 cobalt-precorrin-6A reductase [Streptomyces sp. NBC_01498]
MSRPRVLILGGTAEARRLADVLAAEAPHLHVTTSLAGRVANPATPAGEIRLGGFGGPEALAAWLVAHRVDVLVDATHPFAATISAHAARAAAVAGVELFALRRPGWPADPRDRRHPARSLADAAALLPVLGARRVFLTVGRQGLAAFAGSELDGTHFLVRTVDPPAPPLPRDVRVLLDRGPYTVEGETALLLGHRVDVVVTKDSGGAATAAKLTAARELGLPVVVVERPPSPEGVPEVPDVRGALARLGLSPAAADTCP